MTTVDLLSRLNAHLSANNEYASRILLPDLVPFIAPSLHQLTEQIRADFDKRNLLLKEVQIDIIEQLSEGFYRADLSQAQALRIITATPYPMVSIGCNQGALFSKQPPACDGACQAFEDTYYVIGKDLIAETEQTLSIGDKVAIVGYQVPTLDELPPELEDDLINIVAQRLSMLRQSVAREEK